MREPHDGSWAAADQSDGPGAWTEPRQTPVLRSIQQVAADRAGGRPRAPAGAPGGGGGTEQLSEDHEGVWTPSTPTPLWHLSPVTTPSHHRRSPPCANGSQCRPTGSIPATSTMRSAARLVAP